MRHSLVSTWEKVLIFKGHYLLCPLSLLPKFSKPGFSSTRTVNFQIFKLDLAKAEEPKIKLPMSTESLKKQKSPEKHPLLLYWLCKSLWLDGSQQTVQNSERDGNTWSPSCLLRNLHAGQESSVRTGQGTTDWFQIGKGVCQGSILSRCLFNLYVEYVMQNARWDEAQAGIKIAGRNTDNLRYTGDTTLMAESEEKSKEPLESERGEWKCWLQTQHSEN